MSQNVRRDGPFYIDQMVAMMQELREQLPLVSPDLPPEVHQTAAERLQRLSDMLVPMRKKLFVKTQGGTEIARQCAEQVVDLKQKVLGLSSVGNDVATDRLEEALKAAEEKIEPFVDKTQNLVIRMT
jgi:hypothetical protein